MYVFVLHNNNASLKHFYLHKVMNAGRDNDARKFDNRKNRFFEFENQFL